MTSTLPAFTNIRRQSPESIRNHACSETVDRNRNRN